MEKSGYPTQELGNSSMPMPMAMPMPGSQYPPIPGQIPQGGYNPNYNHQEPPPNYETAQGHEMNKNFPNMQHPVIVSQQPIFQENVRTIYAPPIGPDPTRINCPSCGQHVTTRMDYETTSRTHLWALLLCCCVCWPCAWIPYVMDSCKNANHYCPGCGAFIGTYKS